MIIFPNLSTKDKLLTAWCAQQSLSLQAVLPYTFALTVAIVFEQGWAAKTALCMRRMS